MCAAFLDFAMHYKKANKVSSSVWSHRAQIYMQMIKLKEKGDKKKKTVPNECAN